MYFGPGISVGRRGISYGDSDAQAFISATGLTGTTEVNAVTNLVANLKTYGLWSKMKAIYPFVSDTYNLLSYTEDFGNAVWNKQGVTISGDTTTAPNGTNTADTLEKVGGSGGVNYYYIVRSDVTSNTTNAFSIYVKYKSGSGIIWLLGKNSANFAYFNIQTGVALSKSSGMTTSIQSVGNGWYRCSFVQDYTSASQYSIGIGVCLADGTPNYDATSASTQSVYIWGAQLEQSASATTYQPIATTPANRFVSQFKYNLKDPRDLDAAFRLAFNGTWAYSKQGALPNGTNAFADTKLNPTTLGFTQTDTHMSAYLRTDSNGAKVDIGGSYNLFMGVRWANNYNYPINRSNNANGTSSDSLGYFLASRVDNVRDRMFKNGTNVTNFTGAAVSLDNNTIVISATNGGGLYSDRQTSFNTIGYGLTDTEATNLYTSVQQFNQDLSRQVGVPIVSDSDAQSFLNAAQITDLTQANAINTLVVGLKNASLWTKMKAIYPFVGGTATSHKWNLKDPRDLDAAYRLAFYGAWTHSSTGALPNGTNAYADTKLIPNSHLSIESNHMSFYSRTQANTYAIEMGCEAVTAKDLILYHGFLARKTIVDGAFGTNEASSNITNTLGYQIGSRTSLSNLKLYWNNSLLATNTATKTDGQNSISIIIGATNKTTIGGYSSKQVAFSTIGDGLNDSDASTLYTLVQNFQTTLGRQV